MSKLENLITKFNHSQHTVIFLQNAFYFLHSGQCGIVVRWYQQVTYLRTSTYRRVWTSAECFVCAKLCTEIPVEDLTFMNSKPRPKFLFLVANIEIENQHVQNRQKSLKVQATN